MPQSPERVVQLESSWKEYLGAEFDKPYMQSLRQFLQDEKRAGKRIFPAGGEFFSAFDNTPFDAVKVVILGQDPYHGPGQAHGLCFSVKPGVAVPPSLANVYRELADDLGCVPPGHGYLTHWAEQGVLLLNSVLSVECAKAASHQGKGWERFTDAAVAALNDARDNLVFMLWGGYAQRKGAVIDEARHCVLRAPHPSPLSAHRGFFGCRHFSAANAYLKRNAITPVDWQLPQNP